jgi:predicted dinucleotide-binding enzyme
MIAAILGNSPLNIGVASAAELSAAGHEVRVALCDLPRRIGVAGGEAVALRPMLAEDALRGADLVVVDIPPRDLMRVLAPYWPARRPMRRASTARWWFRMRVAAACVSPPSRRRA